MFVPYDLVKGKNNLSAKLFFILVRFQPIWHRKTVFMAKLSLASLTSELEPLMFIEGERERDLLFIN